VNAQEIVIPYKPRPLQRVLHDALEQHRWAVAVCHRRFGKTVLAVNELQKSALRCQRVRPRMAYLAPTYRQGKAVAWDYLKHFSAPIPGVRWNESELRVDYPTGAQIRIYGADNPDSLRGIYLDGVVLDEYGLMDPTVWEEVIRATLTDREGWAFFIGTPSGKNQFYDLVRQAQSDPAWYTAEYRASQTGILPEAELASAKASMTADQYAQEFECSFEASVRGAVYAREMQAAREDGRVTVVPYDPALPVHTSWDLGYRDRTAIWFSQHAMGGQVRLIDYLEGEGQGLPYYVQAVNAKPYTYGEHWMPHDAQQHEFGSGTTVLQTAQAMLRPVLRVAPRLSLEDGVHALRMLLPRCWFDAGRCRDGLDALTNYRWDFNAKVQDYTALPVHDWASHGSDAARTLATWYQAPKLRRPPPHSLRDWDPDDPRPTRGMARGGYA
jgi:phage terminase large subunit